MHVYTASNSSFSSGFLFFHWPWFEDDAEPYWEEENDSCHAPSDFFIPKSKFSNLTEVAHINGETEFNDGKGI